MTPGAWASAPGQPRDRGTHMKPAAAAGRERPTGGQPEQHTFELPGFERHGTAVPSWPSARLGRVGSCPAVVAASARIATPRRRDRVQILMRVVTVRERAREGGREEGREGEGGRGN